MSPLGRTRGQRLVTSAAQTRRDHGGRGDDGPGSGSAMSYAVAAGPTLTTRISRLSGCDRMIGTRKDDLASRMQWRHVGGQLQRRQTPPPRRGDQPLPGRAGAVVGGLGSGGVPPTDRLLSQLGRCIRRGPAERRPCDWNIAGRIESRHTAIADGHAANLARGGQACRRTRGMGVDRSGCDGRSHVG